jgi:hypothetical protein
MFYKIHYDDQLWESREEMDKINFKDFANAYVKVIVRSKTNPLNQNVIGFMTVLPPEFGLHRFVDDDLQFEKAFVEPTKLILDAIGWHVEPTSSLEDFFG